MPRTARITKIAALTPAQKAARTKRRMGLDLSEIAAKAVATRAANKLAAELAMKAAARKAAAMKAANTRRAARG